LAWIRVPEPPADPSTSTRERVVFAVTGEIEEINVSTY